MASSRVPISSEDFRALIDLITRLPGFDDVSARRPTWVTPAFRGYERGQAAAVGTPVQGETPMAASKMADYLIEFGGVDAGVHALGAFLRHAAGKLGVEDAALAEGLIARYGLHGAEAPPRRPRGDGPTSHRVAGRLNDAAELPWGSSPAADAAGLERLKREHNPDLLPASFLDEGARVKRAVAQIDAHFASGTLAGTGFLIGDGLLLTCHHVLFDAKGGDAPAERVDVVIGFERTLDNLASPTRRFKGELSSIIADKASDWAVIRLLPSLGDDIPRLPLGADRPVAVDDRVYILQHPGGKEMRVALHGNLVRDADDDAIQYLADTEQGSSGAPVFNARWQVVGLHRRWVELHDAIDVFRNEAVNIQRVMAGLRAKGVPFATGGGQQPPASPASAAPPSAETAPPPADPLAALTARIQAEGPAVRLEDEEVTWLRSGSPRTEQDYRLRRVADWREPHLALRGEDLRRFTRLSLMIDKGEDAEFRWTEEKREYRDLAEVLRAAEKGYRVLVLLGEPGAGKTTLLRRLELDLACRALGWVGEDEDGASDGEAAVAATGLAAAAAPEQAPLTFYLPLSEYRDASIKPLDWLAARWKSAYQGGADDDGMPPLLDLLRRRPVLLLLDALNEMPHGGSAGSYAERVAAWSLALQELQRDYPLTRAIFSCRSMDYSSVLSSTALRVPHVQVKPLENPQVQAFLACYLPDQADGLWAKLRGSEQLEIYRRPYFLKLLVDQVGTTGEIPSGRAALFSGFLRRAMQRELNERKNPRFTKGDLLHEGDRTALNKDGKRLPEKGPLIPGLAALAFKMQTVRGAGQQVVADKDDVLSWDLHPSAATEAILQGGYDLGVIEFPWDADRETELLKFNHQLMQEYFAARHLAAHPNASLTHSAWLATEVAEPLATTLANLPKADRLLGLPQTGWEVTALLAAAQSNEPDAFVRSLADGNLPLAARCAAEPGVVVQEDLKAELRNQLIQRCRNPKADLRARIDAGKALGTLGDDPRFSRGVGPDGAAYLLPPLVEIPGGRYTIGATDGWPWERPVHEAVVAPFAIGRYPVTNAEYACFLEAGGYKDERWWETEDAKAWLRGDPKIVEPAKEDRRKLWRQLQLDEVGFAAWLEDRPGITDRDWYEWFRKQSPDDLEVTLARWYPAEEYSQPDFWDNSRYNNPTQPVVGVSWYEARAYCAWLSAQSGLDLRLPTEVEWEAAARGAKARRYAYGDTFDAALCNTHESHLRVTTPIDVFPGGETPEGLVDMAGNVWDWTLSLWGHDRGRIDDRYRYPYRPGEGREEVTADPGCARVLRGGSWNNNQNNARAAYRNNNHPTNRNNNVGFRVVRGSPISPVL